MSCKNNNYTSLDNEWAEAIPSKNKREYFCFTMTINGPKNKTVGSWFLPKVRYVLKQYNITHGTKRWPLPPCYLSTLSLRYWPKLIVKNERYFKSLQAGASKQMDEFMLSGKKCEISKRAMLVVNDVSADSINKRIWSCAQIYRSKQTFTLLQSKKVWNLTTPCCQ